MKLETLTYSRTSGWSIRPFPKLDSEETLVIVFGASSFASDPKPLAELGAEFPRSHCIGCSTSGEIFGPSLTDETLVVAIVKLERSEVSTACASVREPADSFEVGRGLAQRLSRRDLKAVLVLSDGLRVNGSDLVRGFNSALPSSVVVTGGLAGDGDKFKNTWVLGENKPRSGLVSAVGFYGEHVRVGHGSKGGWDIFGPERLVTRSEGNVLYQVDGKPALQLYKQYLGERAKGLPATALLFPLALRVDGRDTKVLVRTVLSIDEEAQSLTFAGNIPEGHLAQLMRANLERLIEGASKAASLTRFDEADEQGDSLAIAISCVGRRLVLGERTEEEIEATLGELSARTKQIGFYSYGEISPFESGHADLHNQTMTLTTISES
jgi:hypothetical protein